MSAGRQAHSAVGSMNGFCVDAPAMTDKVIEVSRGGLLQAGGNMGVCVEGDADRGVPEPLLEYLRVDAGLQHEACMSVARVMEADIGEAETPREAFPRLGEGVREHRPAVYASEQQGLVLERDSGRCCEVKLAVQVLTDGCNR